MVRRDISGIVMMGAVSHHLDSYADPMVTLKGTRCNAGYAAGVSLSTCLCIHAEENALLEAGRERIGEGSTLYCDT